MNNTELKYKEVKAEIYNFRAWTNTSNIEGLVETMNAALDYAGYTVLKFVDYQFPVKGYTSLWLLAESHLALHYFEEQGRCYVELSGCNQTMNVAFRDFLKQKELNYELITDLV